MEPQAAVEGLRRVSRTAFGHTHRLELMLAIAEISDGVCSLRDLADRLGVRPSSIQRPLDSLVELSLLSALPGGDTKFRHYIRNDSPAWAWARELADGVELTGVV
ncbi:MAG: helix-turn-helix domain-containing protein [Actinobacteria bacterium]|nr:helix-turn-helix domain-containing protein [Actinomycetota bacterium]